MDFDRLSSVSLPLAVSASHLAMRALTHSLRTEDIQLIAESASVRDMTEDLLRAIEVTENCLISDLTLVAAAYYVVRLDQIIESRYRDERGIDAVNGMASLEKLRQIIPPLS